MLITTKHTSKITLTAIVTTVTKATVTVIVVIYSVLIALTVMQLIAPIVILKSGYKQTVTVLAHIIAIRMKHHTIAIALARVKRIINEV